ncbi:metal-dependent hydrolase family protein [Actinocrispum wychmicini]|uniref:Imidazolonepropionase-like amidohydrolase n=1 Tax=Actinocrispum wychmicini TaxID=1213861 RepID=A0A4V2S5L5_9PSEU|nr:amidohydrolase family protein [Actinocrispum wychmicini]TCO52650.1 imidazolonepropionase-like amidohydrolase [Actinocrispum wychmicini]
MPQPWAVRARRVFDGETFFDQPGLVVVQDGTVTAVDFGTGLPSADLPVVDLGDVTLLPGLVDAHTHLVFDPPANVAEQMASEDDDTLLGRAREHAQQALRAGITTVRDLGDRNYLSLAVRAETAVDPRSGPELLVAGPPITSVGGHCWFLGGEAEGAGDLRAAVAERARRGVDVIKVMATGGNVTPGSDMRDSQYDFDELRVVVAAAHEAGLRVTAHAHGGKGIADAVRAGIDGIEHGTFLTPTGAEPDWATVRALGEAGTYLGVTVGGATLTPRLAAIRRGYARMRREGVRMVCASDAGVVAQKPHDCLPRVLPEFVSFSEATTIDGLRAVTSLAARSCGVADRKGRIAPGYDADLLAVAGNPVDSLAALSDVQAVFRRGQRVTT